MMKYNFLKRAWMVSIALLVILATGTKPAFAEHPHYLHALSDLRTARAMLNHPAEYNVDRDQFAAIDDINRAIGEIRRAAIDDGKDLNYAPPVDARLDYASRLRQVARLLDSAIRDLGYEEDDMAALGWRNAAIDKVAHARGWVGRAMHDKHVDENRE